MRQATGDHGTARHSPCLLPDGTKDTDVVLLPQVSLTAVVTRCSIPWVYQPSSVLSDPMAGLDQRAQLSLPSPRTSPVSCMRFTATPRGTF